MAQGSGKRIVIKYTPCPELRAECAASADHVRIMYSGFRKSALSPPAFEQYPVFSRVRADRPISAMHSSPPL